MNNGLTHNESTNVLLKRAAHDIEQVHAALVGNLRELGERLLEQAARLEREGVDAEVNADGVVQGRGALVDVACARFMSATSGSSSARRTGDQNRLFEPIAMARPGRRY